MHGVAEREVVSHPFPPALPRVRRGREAAAGSVNTLGGGDRGVVRLDSLVVDGR